MGRSPKDSTTSPEVVAAGAQEAARAMSRLLRRVPLSVGVSETLSFDALAARHRPRALLVGFTLSGGVHGRLALVMTEASARALAHDLMGPDERIVDADDVLTRRALGALTELGNIGASGFMNGVAGHIGATCIPSVPAVVLDDADGAVMGSFGEAPALSVARLDIGEPVDLALMF
jgi:chemotaxis protein CheC